MKPEYCEGCNHADFAHNGAGRPDDAKRPTGCDLCMCEAFERKELQG